MDETSPTKNAIGHKAIVLGSSFGRWTVLSRHGPHALCRCSCGIERRVRADGLRNGTSTSCGCGQARAVRHGGHGTPAYRSWQKMRDRCLNPRFKQYRDYGGRGVTVCERWQDFAAFIEDMGERPEGATLDRYPDKNGNYEPGNCRWATRKEQQRNTRRNVYVTAFGETLLLVDMAAKHNLPAKCLGQRLKMGWDAERAVTQPVIPRGPRRLP